VAWKQLSGDCKDGNTCPSVWADEEGAPGDVIVVGSVVDPSVVPVGPGEVAVRLRRRLLSEAYEQDHGSGA